MALTLSRIAAALLIALTLAACATMSPQECRVANWNDVGLRDGLDGRPLSLLGEARRLPPNDGGLALGQAAVAAARSLVH